MTVAQAKPEGLRSLIAEKAEALGFAAVGVTGVDALSEWDHEIERRVEAGIMSAKQRQVYLRRLGSSPSGIMPAARSIVVLARPYVPFVSPFPKGAAGYSAHYCAYPQGHAAALLLARELEGVGVRTAAADASLPVKPLAVRAGIGSYGLNSLVHCRESGSFVTLHAIVTDAALDADESSGASAPDEHCGGCGACVQACPTGAIQQAGGVVDLARCVRAYMNSGEIVPVEIRLAYGANILGCDACQRCCPLNARASSRAVEPSMEALELFSLAGILGDGVMERRTRLEKMRCIIGRNYARENRILADAAIAAGNTKEPSLLAPLASLISHPHEPVRAHAAWAIGRIGGPAAVHVLEKALSAETSPRVVKEIEEALDGCR
ncbi:MAG: HEAT repeat domain-containing protein [Firmicutes bacterium]|jgi:epoxyqueuosine reductase|nr:HEAT repeat domain-containing protein [Bacillota bacterium]MDH7496526.1 4Fe-4S double cluster binding domain-containing protein [Bacillota bacterium]